MEAMISQKLKQLVRRAAGTPQVLAAVAQVQERLNGMDTRLNEALAPCVPQNVREAVAFDYLRGHGLEIGAFASPLKVPAEAHVTYLDRFDPEKLEREFHVAGLTPADFGFDAATLVPPDIVDDGESMAKVGDLTQDFVIANHVLEHFENPVKGFKNMLRTLKHGGILYLALPEMEHSFDRIRTPTPFEHVWRDYTDGPAWSRPMAYAEFAKVFVDNGMAKGLFAQKSGADRSAFEDYVADELAQANFNIHFHAWRMVDMIDMFVQLKSKLNIGFDIELIRANGDEVIFVFRKIPYRVL